MNVNPFSTTTQYCEKKITRFFQKLFLSAVAICRQKKVGSLESSYLKESTVLISVIVLEILKDISKSIRWISRIFRHRKKILFHEELLVGR